MDTDILTFIVRSFTLTLKRSHCNSRSRIHTDRHSCFNYRSQAEEAYAKRTSFYDTGPTLDRKVLLLLGQTSLFSFG